MSSEKVSDLDFLNYIKSFGSEGILQSKLVSHFGFSSGGMTNKLKPFLQNGTLRKEKYRNGRANTFKVYYNNSYLDDVIEDITEDEIKNPMTLDDLLPEKQEQDVDEIFLSQGLVDAISRFSPGPGTLHNAGGLGKHARLLMQVKEELGL